jgi:shikimate kinase
MIEVDKHRCWDRSQHILLIGPGGAGKSSLGIELAPLLSRCLVDLDSEFIQRVGNIGRFIREEGYDAHKRRNATLAGQIIVEAADPMLLVTSSGFLTSDNPPEALAANHRVLAACYSICLLPSRDVERAVQIIVQRQVTRPFTSDWKREEATIRARYPLYVQKGDLRVFSTLSPKDTAGVLMDYITG